MLVASFIMFGVSLIAAVVFLPLGVALWLLSLVMLAVAGHWKWALGILIVSIMIPWLLLAGVVRGIGEMFDLPVEEQPTYEETPVPVEEPPDTEDVNPYDLDGDGEISDAEVDAECGHIKDPAEQGACEADVFGGFPHGE
ncbi:MAG: hypothetical protein M3198_03500 [Actinomycetota bacterium]|nr:hypothetical protein [Actinomycetota bacterium]